MTTHRFEPLQPARSLPNPGFLEMLISLLGALLVLGLLLFGSTITTVVNLTQFGETVRRFFHARVEPEPTRPARVSLSSEGAQQERARLLSSDGGGLFEAPPMEPDVMPGSELGVGGAIPLRMDRPAAPILPAEPAARVRHLEEEAAPEPHLDLETVMARHAGRDAPKVELPDLQDAFRKRSLLEGGPGRAGALGGEVEFTPPDDRPPRITAAPGEPLEPAARRTAEAVQPLMRKLLDERPPGGYPPLDREVSADFTVYREPGSPEAFFRLTIDLDESDALPVMQKDVLILFDISESIRSHELRIMRDAVVEALARLRPGDRWNVAVFSNQTLFFGEGFLPASEYEARREDVYDFMRRRPGQRRTNVFEATRKVLHGLARSERPCNVFLVSDGEATSGTGQVERIVEGFRRVRRQSFAIFTFNAGPGGNNYLLQLLAYRSRGFHHRSPDLTTAKAEFLRFYETFREPVLHNAIVHYTNLDPDDVHPEVLPSLYRDRPLVIYGRSSTGRTVTMRVAGIDRGGPREFFFRTEVPAGTTDHPEVLRQWAQGKAHAMMAVLAEDPDNDELRERILELARRHELESTVEMVRPRGFFSPLRRLFGRDR